MSLQECTNLNDLKNAGVKRFSFGNVMSDAVISYIEVLSKQIQVEQSTKTLYNHPARYGIQKLRYAERRCFLQSFA
jgi:2-methylisocitrate lyase-like PEP mutase family enzyme